MTSSSHRWEEDLHAWEDDEVRWDEESDAEDPELSSKELAGIRLGEMLVSLCLTTTLSCKLVCVLAFWASRAGACGPCELIAMAPSDRKTNHYRDKFDRALNLRSREKWLYDLDMPGLHKFEASRKLTTVPVMAAHELINDEYTKNSTVIAKKVHEPHAVWRTPAYCRHERDSAKILLPLALYLDGVVFQKRDSVLGFWLYNIATEARQLFCVLKKSFLCKCGCRGWCTLYQVMLYIAWMLKALLKGVYETTRHDGAAWLPSDHARAAIQGTAMAVRAIVVFVKCDWAEFAHTLGFPTWASNLYPCMLCNCTREDMHKILGLDRLHFPYRLHDVNGINAACAACEIRIIICEGDRRTILNALSYDKRKDGSHGRALQHDVTIRDVTLLKADRLEPSLELADVGALESVALPTTLTFWRTSAETLTRHRNPLFQHDTGVDQNSLAMDALHTLHLGVFLNYCKCVLWALIDCGYCYTSAFVAKHTAAELFALIVPRLRNNLWSFYDILERQLGHKVTRLTDLTTAMLGESAHRKLKTKAAETRWLIPFCLEMATKHSNALGEAGAQLGIAGRALVKYWETVETAPPQLKDCDIQVFRYIYIYIYIYTYIYIYSCFSFLRQNSITASLFRVEPFYSKPVLGIT
jgi:hypothetical protein